VGSRFLPTEPHLLEVLADAFGFKEKLNREKKKQGGRKRVKLMWAETNGFRNEKERKIGTVTGERDHEFE